MHAAIPVSLLAASLAASCVATPPTSRLDSSGVTVGTHAEALLLASAVPELTSAARDYAVVGPVEINRSGELDFFLWVGLASTVDRARVGLTPPDAEALALVVDGEPMVIPLVEWQTPLDVPPYGSVVPIYDVLVAPASLDQIRRIASAEDVELLVVTRSGRATKYQIWQGDRATWSSFAPEL